MMKSFRISALVIVLVLFSVAAMQAQEVTTPIKKEFKQANDSLLNVITDIDSRIEKHHKRIVKAGFETSAQEPLLLDKGSIMSNLHIAKRNDKGLVIYPYTWTPFEDGVSFRDTVILEPAFLPVVFDGRILAKNLDFRQKKDESDYPRRIGLIDRDSTFAPRLAKVAKIREQRRNYYVSHPEQVRINAFRFANNPVITKSVVEKESSIKDLITIDDKAVALVTPDVETVKIKQVNWKKTGRHELNLSETQVTQYWEGNERDNNISINNEHELNLNYKKGKVSLDNKMLWYLKLMSSPADTIHAVTVQTDRLEFYSVLGLESFVKKWSYAVSLEVKTPLFNSYPKNGTERQRSFLSPLFVNPSIGLTYKLNKVSPHDKYKNLTLNLDLSPISVNYTLVRDKSIDATKFSGIQKGKKSRVEVGHKIKADLTYNFNRYTSLRSILDCYTNYERVQMKSENKFSYSINRFFAVNLNLDIRFDDSMNAKQKDDKWGYFQYNQELRFGLAYNW